MGRDLCFMPAGELALRIARREVSPVEVVRAHLDRIAKVNPALGAIVTLIEDADERARAAEGAVMRGDALGPLHGVPVTVKDCIDTAGTRTTRGSRLFEHRVPTRNATVVDRLLAAGAIPVAKTNLPEFALWWETENLVFGRTVNPWDSGRTPGGSSGGEAAAIASGMSPLGLGCDVGGSVRGPAHYCGIVGFKPTHGLVPLTGHWPDTLLRFNHVGPLARTVADVALAVDAIAGPDALDSYSCPVPRTGEPPVTGSVRGLRVGWMADRGFGPIASEVIEVVARAAAALRAAGAEVEPATVPALERHDWHALSLRLYVVEAGTYFQEVVGDRTEWLHPALRRRLSAPPGTLQEYVEAAMALEELRRDLARYFTRSDLLLCPPAPVVAYPHGLEGLRIGDVDLPPRHVLRPLIPFDLTGSPALSVPFGASPAGLPVGVQVAGRRFDEATVVRAGLALEEARGAWRRPPEVSV